MAIKRYLIVENSYHRTAARVAVEPGLSDPTDALRRLEHYHPEKYLKLRKVLCGARDCKCAGHDRARYE